MGEELHLPYDRPPLSKQVLAGTWPPEKAVLADKRRSSELRVHEVLGRRAVRLDVAGRRSTLDDGTMLAADGIVVATGAAPAPAAGHRGAGRRATGCSPCAPSTTALALRAAVTAVESARVDRHRCRLHRRRGRLDLCRAGVPGHRARGARHPVAERARAGARRVLRLAARGATGWTCAPAWRWRACPPGADDRPAAWLVVELAGGEALEADVVVVGIGVAPAVGWLEDSGLTLENGVVCDDRLFAADGVVAAGDVARWLWRHAGG